MIPAYFLLIYGAIAIPVSLFLGWAAREFNFLHLGTKYDKGAEMAEQFTADKAERIAKYFSGIAAELRAPGK